MKDRSINSPHQMSVETLCSLMHRKITLMTKHVQAGKGAITKPCLLNNQMMKTSNATENRLHSPCPALASKAPPDSLS